jgi:hypothetical protein
LASAALKKRFAAVTASAAAAPPGVPQLRPDPRSTIRPFIG